MNYVHANAVKHGYVKRAAQWPHSSVHDYLDCWGQETMRRLWHEFPVLNYGDK